MLPHHLPELAGKTSKDTRTIHMALKYVAIAVIAICTVAVSALYVKLYILQVEPSFHNKVNPIQEDKEPVHKEQDQVYVVGVNLEFEHPTTIIPTLKAKQCEPVNQESLEDKNNNLKQKHLKSHIFQSILPTNMATELTNNVEIAKPIEKSHIKNEDSNLNQNPFRNLFPSFNFTDEKEQKINNERKENDNNPFEHFFNFLIKPIFDSEGTSLGVIRPIDLFEPSETFLNFPSNKPNFNSQEEIFTPIDSLKEGENFIHFSKSFFDSLEEPPESTTTSSNESRKHLEFPLVGIKSLDTF